MATIEPLPSRRRSTFTPVGEEGEGATVLLGRLHAYSMEQAEELARFNEKWWKTAARFLGLMLGGVSFVLLIYLPPAPAIGEAKHLTFAAAWYWFAAYGTVSALLSVWTYKFALVRYCWWQMVVMWIVPYAISQLSVLFFDLALHIYPVPFSSFTVGAPASCATFFFAYIFLPKQARADKVRVRACLYAWACAVWLICCLALWIVFRAVFNSLTGTAQALSVMLLPLLRFLSLRGMEAISSRAAPDGSLDAAASFTLKHYNSFFAASLYGNASSVSSLLIVLQELVGTSAYLLKMSGFMDRVTDALCRRNRVHSVDALPSIEEDQSGGVGGGDGRTWRQRVLYGEKTVLSHGFRRMLRTSGFLAMEDVVENMVAFQWGIMLAVFYYGYQRKAMYVLSALSDAAMMQSMQFLLITFLTELAMLFVAAAVCQRKYRLSLLHHVAYLLKQHFWFLLSNSISTTMFSISLLFSFNGFGLLLA